MRDLEGVDFKKETILIMDYKDRAADNMDAVDENLGYLLEYAQVYEKVCRW